MTPEDFNRLYSESNRFLKEQKQKDAEQGK